MQRNDVTKSLNKKIKSAGNVEVVPYRSEFEQVFKDLNVAWIEKYWEMEPADYKALEKPTENIIEKGGYIAIVLHEGRPVGTCALMKMDDDCYELAKMAVADEAKGLGIGFLLGQHVIEQAKVLGANRLYLESNTTLVPAINLYRKLGFVRVSGNDSPYERCDIQMELEL